MTISIVRCSTLEHPELGGGFSTVACAIICTNHDDFVNLANKIIGHTDKTTCEFKELVLAKQFEDYLEAMK